MEKKRVFGTGGELLVHQLVAQGVRYAFTNTGSAEAGFFNALLTVQDRNLSRSCSIAYADFAWKGSAAADLTAESPTTT